MTVLQGKKRSKPHPYLHGNFAPIHKVHPLTACPYEGTIPEELAGGEYVRNGGNPVTNEDLGRDAHWFDGDGMLSGVAFRKTDKGIQPEFVNQYILTDAYLSTITTPSLRLPILPSIATLVNPASTLICIVLRIFRTILLVAISHLWGSQQAIKKISVANTGILYHDGRALATCESGPPMRVSLPGLETIGWFDGRKAEGEPEMELLSGDGFGGVGLLSFMKEWTTAHPRVDPHTNELVLFHSTFLAPFVYYSILPATQNTATQAELPRMVNAGVPGVASPKMMHDFGVSFSHTVIMDLPLSLDPRNLIVNKPVVSYDPTGRSRFGVFPRWSPDQVRWFETNPCCIFHTANTWDTISKSSGQVTNVNMLACRLTSASLVFSAGDVAAPMPTSPIDLSTAEEEQCRLYYYNFDLCSPSSTNTITHQFALSAIPFEFPSLREDKSMSAAKFIYGCSVSDSSFGAALGRAVKIDSLVKIDATALITRGISSPVESIRGCVDTRSVGEILASNDPHDPIQIFKLPHGWYAQESRFVPRNGGTAEDDGWILSYVFDESQLDAATGEVPLSAKSELWVVDARDMKTIVCRVKLPQRVPYGLHGNWFSEADIEGQRPVETIRHASLVTPKSIDFDSKSKSSSGNVWADMWLDFRKWLLNAVG